VVAHRVVECRFIFGDVNGEKTYHESRYVREHMRCICEYSKRSRNYTTSELQAHENKANEGNKEEFLHSPSSLLNLFLKFLVMLQRAFVHISIFRFFIEGWLPGSVIIL